jgi:hypothetical protein
MQQPEPSEAREDEDDAMERRFADLMRRFWHAPEPADQGDTQ